MQRNWIGTLAALASLAACGGAGGTPAAEGADRTSGSAAPIVLSPQDLATATTRLVGAVVLVSGSLDPADIVQVRAQVPGTVDGVRVDRGTRVSRGAVMAVIEALGIRSQAAGAQAAVASAEAQAALAQQRLEAARRLYGAGAISSIDYKAAQAAMQAANAQVAAAKAVSVGAGESAARATVTSPIDGIVSARFVSGGEAVNPGAPLFTVVDASELELAGRIGIQDAARVRAGQTVTFTLDAFPNQPFRGRVARVDPTADPGTRQVGVYVRLPNPGSRLVGGQYARGRIETGSAQNAVVIPAAALLAHAADSATVFVVTGNRLARRQVALGLRDDASGLIAVVSGVRAGERVLLNPSADLSDGTMVSVANDAPARPNAAR